MNTRPLPQDQLTTIHNRVGKLAGTPGPAQELTLVVANLIEHIQKSDKRITELEKRLAALAAKAK